MLPSALAQDEGTITVTKDTDPDGSPQNFTFAPSYGDNFTLADGQTNVSAPLAPGNYNVSELVPEGWALTNATCSDESDPSNISLEANETVDCVFTNTQLGRIIVVKRTEPAMQTEAFEFATTYGDPFALRDGENNTSAYLMPGEYRIHETVPDLYELTSIVCDGGDHDTNVTNGDAIVNLSAGAIVTCTFTNTHETVCPFTQGFWKNHAERGRGKRTLDSEWPVDNLTIGGVTYTEEELVRILQRPPRGDASMILVHQLIAAMLNRENGTANEQANETHTVDDLIAQANALLAPYEIADPGGLLTGRDGYGVKTSTADGQELLAIAELLELFNEGVLTPGCNANVAVEKFAADFENETFQKSVAIDVGDEAVYVLFVNSTGPGAATDVTAEDMLPGGGWTILVQGDLTPELVLTPDDACDLDAFAQNLTCALGQRNATTSYALIVLRPTTADDCGFLNNTATVATSGVDNDPGDDTSSASIYVRCADLSVELLGGYNNTTDVLRIQANISNAGPDAATEALVNITLPDVNATWVAPAGCVMTSLTTGECDLGAIVAGHFALTGFFEATLADPVDCGLQHADALVSSTNDPDPTNNTDGRNYLVDAAFCPDG